MIKEVKKITGAIKFALFIPKITMDKFLSSDVRNLHFHRHYPQQPSNCIRVNLKSPVRYICSTIDSLFNSNNFNIISIDIEVATTVVISSILILLLYVYCHKVLLAIMLPIVTLLSLYNSFIWFWTLSVCVIRLRLG